MCVCISMHIVCVCRCVCRCVCVGVCVCRCACLCTYDMYMLEERTYDGGRKQSYPKHTCARHVQYRV